VPIALRHDLTNMLGRLDGFRKHANTSSFEGLRAGRGVTYRDLRHARVRENPHTLKELPMTEKPPAGWYPDSKGTVRWWDGDQWTNITPPPTPEPAAPAEDPALTAAAEEGAAAPARVETTSTVSEATSPDRAAAGDDRPWYKKKRYLIPIGVFLVLGVIGAFVDEDTTGGGASGSDSSATASPKESKAPQEAPTPTTPKAKLLGALKETDAEKPRVASYYNLDNGKGKYAEVQFNVGDNITKGTIRTGIANDVFDMAEAALKSGVPFKELAFRGMFPLTDKYGKTEPGQVFFTTFKRSELEKVQFDDIVATSWDNLPNLVIDGIVVLHPDFRE
jgi:hypothetical protein